MLFISLSNNFIKFGISTQIENTGPVGGTPKLVDQFCTIWTVPEDQFLTKAFVEHRGFVRCVCVVYQLS